MAKFNFLNWKRDSGTPSIRDDRSLLEALHMTDAEAASFLGKSRQALNNQLGPKKGPPGTAPLDYFKLSDILVLISSARATGRQFDPIRVGDYVERTRKPREGESDVPFDVIMEMLMGEPSALNTEGADTVIFMLPAFVELRSQRPDAAEELAEVAKELRARDPMPEILIFSSTDMQATMAGKWLDLDTGKTFGRDIVDHYFPTVLVYRRKEDRAIPYVLSEKGTFVEAAHYRGAMMAECLRSLLPDEVSRALQPPGKIQPGELNVAV
jgi:hypothetical protein